MPLHVPPAPAPALRTVLTALGSPTAVREARTPPCAPPRDPLTPELPLPVHVLDRITPRGRAPRTRLAGWRFLIRSGDRAVAAADTLLTPDGWAFSHFFEGPYIASTERALRQAEIAAAAATSRACCPSPSCTCSRSGCTATPTPTPPTGHPAAGRPAGAAGAGPARHRRAPAAPGRRSAARC